MEAADEKTTEDELKSKPSTIFIDLPHDVLALVLTFLPITYCLWTTDRVSKAFYAASKHPMCWDVPIKLGKGVQTTHDQASSGQAGTGLPLSQAVFFFFKHHCPPSLDVSGEQLSRRSLRALSRLTDLRELTISGPSPSSDIEYQHVFAEKLSSLTQLESLTCTAYSVIFPIMPRLHTLVLNSCSNTINLDSIHLPRLSQLSINGDQYVQRLERSTFPHSLRELALRVRSCSPEVLINITSLPSLEVLHVEDKLAVAVLSQPVLCFTSSLTSLELSSVCDAPRLNDQARENLRRMANLTRLHISELVELITADMEVFAALPSLVQARFPSSGFRRPPDSSSFLHAKSLQRLTVCGITRKALEHYARPSLMSLSIPRSFGIKSLAPLAACVNLTYLDVEVFMHARDARILAGLPKLETLYVRMVVVPDCFIQVCNLPRLKQLKISVCRLGDKPDWKAIKALVRLAPTLEKLHISHQFDQQATVLAVSRLTKLVSFCVSTALTDEQMTFLRNCLPHLCELYAGHQGYLMLQDRSL